MRDSLTTNLGACFLVLTLAGCRNDNYAGADERILNDAAGCAFYVEPGIGETSFVKRMKDADKSGCTLP